MAPHATPFPDRMNSIVEFRLELNEIIEVPNKKVCLCSEEKDRFFYADRDIQKIRMRGMVCRDLLRMYEEMVAAEELGENREEVKKTPKKNILKIRRTCRAYYQWQRAKEAKEVLTSVPAACSR